MTSTSFIQTGISATRPTGQPSFQFIRHVLLHTAMIIAMLYALPAQAQNIDTTITLKGWYSKQEVNLGGSTYNDTSLIYGPTLTVNYDRFYGRLTYLTATPDFEFTVNANQSISATKNETDIEFGYYLNELAYIHCGWKSIAMDLLQTTNASITGKGSIKHYGPTFGVGAGSPIGESGLQLNGDFSLLRVTTKTDALGAKNEESQSGYSFLVGLGYPGFQNMYMNLGYMYQIFLAETGSDTVVSGFTFNVGVNF